MMSVKPWGLKLVKNVLITLSFLLGFCLLTGFAQAEESYDNLGKCICINSKASLLHLGSLDSFDITEIGTQAAKLLLECMNDNNSESCKKAWEIYEQIIPNENFGGEYVALQWFCEYFMADEQNKKALLSDQYVASYFDFLSQDNFAELKGYIERKYHLQKEQTLDSPSTQRRHRFYEDFILFNNPRRERWEQSSKIVQAVGLKKGDVVADVGSGSGYFTFRFAELVGDGGRVYAIDTNNRHIEYVARLADKLNIKNVESLPGNIDGFKLANKVDYVFMCSLYHILYGYIREEQRDPFITSVKNALKEDGRFIVVDNALVDDETLPYHGPYISKELIIGQLKRYGFELERIHQFIPQRYVLVFKLASNNSASSEKAPNCAPGCIPITSPASLVNMGLADERPSQGGKEAAALFFNALQTQDRQQLQAARDAYARLMTRENFGNEYSGFLWICDYLLTPEKDRAQLAGRYTDDFVQYFFDNDFDNIKKYTKAKYLHEETVPESLDAKPDPAERLDVTREQMLFWMELLLFNNPYRQKWEKTDEIIKFINPKPGDAIIDVGSGSGYYTFRFADLVGKDGKVYATEMNLDHRNYVSAIAKKYGLNVEVVEAKLNDLNVGDAKADIVFLCSLYDAIYAYSMETVKDQFVASIKKALKPGGRLVIVDNDHVDPPAIPYHGPQIDKRLIIQQLQHYGFHLVDQKQIIPQRYVLIFQLA